MENATRERFPRGIWVPSWSCCCRRGLSRNGAEDWVGQTTLRGARVVRAPIRDVPIRALGAMLVSAWYLAICARSLRWARRDVLTARHLRCRKWLHDPRMAVHHLDDSAPQPFWDNSVPPRLTTGPGDTVVIDDARHLRAPLRTTRRNRRRPARTAHRRRDRAPNAHGTRIGAVGKRPRNDEEPLLCKDS